MFKTGLKCIVACLCWIVFGSVCSNAQTNDPAVTSGIVSTSTLGTATSEMTLTNIPVEATNAPVVSTLEPAMTNEPALTNTTPAVVTDASAMTNKAPAVVASESVTTNKAPAMKADEPAIRVPAYRPFTISGEVGTAGAGGNASWRFADHLGLRGGADYFD